MTRKIALTAALVLAWLTVIAGLVGCWVLCPLGAILWMAAMGANSYAAFEAVVKLWRLDDGDELADVR